jgi:hypothetical protein
MTKERSSHLLAALETQLTLSQINTIQAHAQEKIFESVVDELLQ